MSSADEPKFVWLTALQVKILHAEAISLFGGAQGIRDETLLESALARPQHLHAYDEDATVFDMAESYGVGLAKNYIDGNKRVALLAIRAFLFRNGLLFNPDEVETVTMMEGLAAGEELLSDRIQANSAPR